MEGEQINAREELEASARWASRMYGVNFSISYSSAATESSTDNAERALSRPAHVFHAHSFGVPDSKVAKPIVGSTIPHGHTFNSVVSTDSKSPLGKLPQVTGFAAFGFGYPELDRPIFKPRDMSQYWTVPNGNGERNSGVEGERSTEEQEKHDNGKETRAIGAGNSIWWGYRPPQVNEPIVVRKEEEKPSSEAKRSSALGITWNTSSSLDSFPHLEAPSAPTINNTTPGATGRPLTEFHCYSKLPVEIRLMIMKLNLPGSRAIHVRRIDVWHLMAQGKECTLFPPANLYVNRETRYETLKLYFPLSRIGGAIYFGPDFDILEFPSYWFTSAEEHKSAGTQLSLPLKNPDQVRNLSLDVSDWPLQDINFLFARGIECFQSIETLELYLKAHYPPKIPKIWKTFCSDLRASYKRAWAVTSLTRTYESQTKALPIEPFEKSQRPFDPATSAETEIQECDITPEILYGAIPWEGISESAAHRLLGIQNYSAKARDKLHVMMADELRLTSIGWKLLGAISVVLRREPEFDLEEAETLPKDNSSDEDDDSEDDETSSSEEDD